MYRRPTAAISAAASAPDPPDRSQPPDEVLLTIPAHLSFLTTIRTAVGVMVREAGGADRRRDLRLAVDEAAAVLIHDARPWTGVILSIAHDEADIYVRLVSRRAQPDRRLVITDLTRLLLDSAVESYEVFADGGRGYAILQTAHDGAGPPG